MAHRRVLIRLEVAADKVNAANPIRTGLVVNTPQFRAVDGATGVEPMIHAV